MANYVAFSRSSYFKVRDKEDFEKFCEKWGIELLSKTTKEETLYGFIGPDEWGIPSAYYDKETDDMVYDEEGDGFLKDLAKQLDPEWVAIFQEIGYEKMRYLVGYSVAVKANGEIEYTDMRDIYKSAFVADKQHTLCEY